MSSLLLASGTFKYLRRSNCRFVRPWHLVRHLVIFKFVVNLAKSAPQLQGAGWAFQLGGQATEVDSQFASYRKKERASSPQHVSLASGAPVSLEQCSAVVGGAFFHSSRAYWAYTESGWGSSILLSYLSIKGGSGLAIIPCLLAPGNFIGSNPICFCKKKKGREACGP